MPKIYQRKVRKPKRSTTQRSKSHANNVSKDAPTIDDVYGKSNEIDKEALPMQQKIAQFAFEPYLVTKRAHLRAVENGKVQEGGLFSSGKKVGGQLQPNEEIEVDMAKKYGKEWVSAKSKIAAGAIRNTKIVPKKSMTKEEIDKIGNEKPESDKVKTVNDVTGVIGKGLGKKDKAFGYLSKQDKKTGEYDKVGINKTSKGLDVASAGVGVVGDLTDMILKGKDLKKTWDEKKWDWDLALTGLKVLKSGVSLTANTLSGANTVSNMIKGKPKNTKTGLSKIASNLGEVKSMIGLMGDSLKAGVSLLKLFKKRGKKEFAKFVKDLAKMGKSLGSTLKKLKLVSKKNPALLTSIPLLSAIINGVESFLTYEDMMENKGKEEEMKPVSEGLRNNLLMSLGGAGYNLKEATSDDPKSKAHLFHTEKRGMRFYRDNYYRINKVNIKDINNFPSYVNNEFSESKQMLANSVKGAPIKGKNAGTIKALTAGEIAKMNSFDDVKDKIEQAIGGKTKYSAESAAYKAAVFSKIKRYRNWYRRQSLSAANRLIFNEKVAKQMEGIVSNPKELGKLDKLPKAVNEYELADKLVEINHKRSSKGLDDLIVSGINTGAEVLGLIGSVVSGGTLTMASTVTKGATATYQGLRSGAKFIQKHIMRRKGWFGGDKERSGSNKHKEYVNHAKFLTKMWIDEADKSNLDEAKGAVAEKDNLTSGMEKIKQYLDAAGVKPKDAAEAPAQNIPDMIVDALKER